MCLTFARDLPMLAGTPEKCSCALLGMSCQEARDGGLLPWPVTGDVNLYPLIKMVSLCKVSLSPVSILLTGYFGMI